MPGIPNLPGIKGVVRSGASVNPLIAKFDAWQTTGSDVYVSGVLPANWIATGVMPDSPTSKLVSYTFINPGQSIRQSGYIKSIKVHIYNTSPSAAWAFKLLTWNGTGYRCRESQSFIPIGSGVTNNIQTFILNPPILALEGYIPGLCLPINNTARPGADIPGALAMQRFGPFVKIKTGDINVGDSDPFTTNALTQYGPNGLFIDLAAYSNRPWAVFIGDSIFGCGNSYYLSDKTECWHTDQETAAGDYHTPGGLPGDINLSIPYRLSLRLPSNFKYQNFARSGSTFANLVTKGDELYYMPTSFRASYADPKAVFIHCGVNDINTGQTWVQISANLDIIRNKFPVGTLFYLDEINPWACTDAQAVTTRVMNVNYANYCTTNGWTLIKCHDEMAVVRSSTGLLDDLNPIYSNGDSVHLNLVGADKMAEIMRRYIK